MASPPPPIGAKALWPPQDILRLPAMNFTAQGARHGAHPKILADSTAGKRKASEWVLEGNCPVDFLSHLTGRRHSFSPGMGLLFGSVALSTKPQEDG